MDSLARQDGAPAGLGDGVAGVSGRGPDACRRVLIYSHDTFGLGHLRRARTIADRLAADGRVRVRILSGSPVVDRYAFAPGVDALRLPPVTKRPDGSYASGDPAAPLARTVAERTALIARAAEAFRPDLVLVDKEPAGFHGEMLPVLEAAARRGWRCVLGLRDVLDAPERLAPEWRRKGADAALRHYDEIWVYGLSRLCDPLAGLDLDEAIAARTVYTGYLRRALPRTRPAEPPPIPALARGAFLLVTPGGGGDGEGLVDWVVSAYEADGHIPLPALIAFGPFMTDASRAGFQARIARLPGRLAAIDFDSQIERLMVRARGIVAMGGYNTFCEILSFDKPSILVPRSEPRREQVLRAQAAQGLGLARVLLEEERSGDGAALMAAALKTLPGQPPPSRVVVPGLLDGLDAIVRRTAALTADRAAAGRLAALP